MSNNKIIQRDLAVLWHPCTQMKDHENLPLIPIKRGEGVWLEDFAGKRYLDAISSWWVNLFGHANPYINQAIINQLNQLEHVLLAGFTHEAVIELSERLLALTPANLQKCFYTDNGSAGIEAALKMSFHYWLNSGQTNKTKFVTLQDSYHGETLGALAVGDVSLYKQTYKPLLMEAIIAPSPAGCYAPDGVSYAEYAIEQFAAMEHILATQHQNIAAVIVEPLLQCATGMRMYDAVYLRLLRQACDKYQVHLIADEIAVGFGRTGTMFACEQADISPDFLCLSKGLTGGYLPLCAVLTTNDIYQAFYDDCVTRAFLHSHSYTGNPLACSAALASLDLFAQHDVLAANRKLARVMSEAIQPLKSHPNISEVRQIGLVAAMEMCQQDKQPYPWQQRRGLKVYEYALTQGVLLRPLGNVIYFMPPYVITAEQINLLAQVAADGITRASG